MRVSCNGCRVLRKGCSEDCCIRPCLQWISSSHSQANATLFLAKFYGRAGLVNLINSGPHHLRPRIFKSLLYEACGRIIDPIHGAVGLMTSGKWNLCDEAVEAVLIGTPITTLSPEYSSVLMVDDVGAARKPCDIRHVPKSKDDAALTSSGSDRLHKVKSRKSFKRSAGLSETKQKPKTAGSAGHCNCKWSDWCKKEVDESVSGQTEVSRLPSAVGDDGDSSSAETVVAAKLADGSSDGELELTLGLIGWC